MICAPEETTLRRESSREVSGRSAYFLEPDGGCVEVFSHRRRKLVEAQLFHEPSVCELLAGELAELAIKLKHMLRYGGELVIERFESVAHFHEQWRHDSALARSRFEP